MRLLLLSVPTFLSVFILSAVVAATARQGTALEKVATWVFHGLAAFGIAACITALFVLAASFPS